MSACQKEKANETCYSRLIRSIGRPFNMRINGIVLCLFMTAVFGILSVSSVGIDKAFAFTITCQGGIVQQPELRENGFPYYAEDGVTVSMREVAKVTKFDQFSEEFTFPSSVRILDLPTGSESDELPVGSIDIADPSNEYSTLKTLDLSQCSNLTEISIRQFRDLEVLVLPSSVKTLTVSECRKLDSIQGFANTQSLESIELTSLAYYGYVDFSVPKSLTALTLIDNVVVSSIDGLDEASRLQSLNINNYGGESLAIPNSVRTLSLSSCENLSSLQLPASINNLALTGLRSLTSIAGLEQSTSLAALTVNWTSVAELQVPDSVKTLNCQNNFLPIDVTEKLAACYGADNVLPQKSSAYVSVDFDKLTIAKGQKGIIKVSYQPSSDQWQDFNTGSDNNKRFNKNIVAKNEGVVSYRTLTSAPTWYELEITGTEVGETKLALSFEGDDRFDDASATVSVEVCQEENPAATLDLGTNQVELAYFKDPVSVYPSHIESRTNLLYKVIPVNPSLPLTGQYRIANAEAGKIAAVTQYGEFCQFYPESALGETDIEVKLEDAYSGSLLDVTQTVHVIVNDFEKPRQMEVIPTLTYDKRVHADENILLGAWNEPIANLVSYPEEQSNAAFARLCGRYDKANFIDHIEVDDTDICSASVSGGIGNRQLAITPKQSGTCTLTFVDIWGNEGRCVLTFSNVTNSLLDDQDSLTKASFSQKEYTVKVGDTFPIEGDWVKSFQDFGRGLKISTSNGGVVTLNGSSNPANFLLSKGYALKAGDVTLTITAPIKYDSMNGIWTDVKVLDTCLVHVQEVSETVPVESISLDKSAIAITGAGAEQLSTDVLPSNATNKTVNWSSSDERVATVDAAGKVTSVGKGTATITATTADGGKTATCEVTVSNPVTSVEVDDSSLLLRKGESKTLTATYAGALAGPVDRVGTSISSDAENSIVSISNMHSTDGSDGPIVLTATVTALRSGAEVLTFMFEPEGQTPVAPCEVTVVTPVESIEVSSTSKQVELAAGATETFTLSASVLPEDADEKGIVWTSSDEAVAVVDGSGNVTVLALGEAEITATAKDGSGISGSCALTVLEKIVPATGVTITGAASALHVGEKTQLSANVEPENSTDIVMWSSSDEAVLTVDQSGLVTAVGNGSATISAEAGEVSDTTAAIEVTTPVTAVSLDATALELYVGADPSRLTATVEPATASNLNVTWASSDHDVATVNGEGAVVPVGPGSATITATTVDGGFTASCEITVKQRVTGIALDKSSAEIKGAGFIELKATVAPNNATNKEVNWASDDRSVADVDDNGKVTSIGKGEAVITATTVDGQFNASCVVTVANPVTRVSVEPSSLNLVKGDSATVLVSLSGALQGETDGASIEWFSSDETVASVDEYGTVTAKKTGAATITAKAGEGLLATCSVAVNNPVQSVVLSETSKMVVVGDVDSFRLTASVNPEDGDGAETIVWASSNEAVATVVADGTVTVNHAGETIITATSGGKTASCALTIQPATINAHADATGFAVSVQVADPVLAKELKKAQADEGLSLVVRAIADLTNPAKAAIDVLKASGSTVAEGFDIYFVKGNGEEVSLNENDGRTTITVKVKLTEAMKTLASASLKVHYVGDDGTVEDKETWSDGEYLYFVTEHFSTYVVTGKPLPSGEESDSTGELVPLDTGENLLARTGDFLWPVAAGMAAVVGAAVCLICLSATRRKKS